MEQVSIETADKWVVLTGLFFPSLIGIIVILGVFVWYRWRIAADRRELDDLNPEHMRIKMEALAAEKLAQRKAKEDAAPESNSGLAATANEEVTDEPSSIG